MPGFNIGSAQGLQDIVKDGVVQPLWTIYNNPPPLNATIELPSFYMWLDNSAPNAIYYNITLLVDTTNPLHPADFNLITTDPQTGILQAEGPTRGKLFTAQTVCFRDGNWIGLVEYRFPSSVPAYDPLEISFYKICKNPSLNVGSRTTDGYTANVISNSLPAVPPFVYTAGIQESSTTFFVWLADGEDLSLIPDQPFSVSTVYNGEAMYLSLQFTAASDSPAGFPVPAAFPLSPTGIPVAVQFKYNCIPGVEQLTSNIVATLNYGWTTSLSFQWLKTCPGGNSPRRGLNIGLLNGGFDVVNNGITAPVYETFPGQPFGPGIRYVAFYASLASTAGYPDTQSFNISYSQLTVPPILTFNAPFSPFPQKLSVNSSVESMTQYTCYKPGKASMEADISVFPYDSILILYEFVCTFPLLDISIRGSSDPSLTLVKNSNVTLSGRTAYYESPVDENQLELFVRLTNPGSDAIYTQPFDVSIVNFDPTVITSTSINVPSNIANATSQPFFFSYTCNPNLLSNDGQPKATIITLELNFGWNTIPVFSWTKLCATNGGNKSQDDSTWSPAGIFFFTLFIILLVAFLAKYLYNYFHLQERGLDAVPCIDYMRKCYNWMLGNKEHHYGPQSDDERVQALSGGKSYGAASYQTDL